MWRRQLMLELNLDGEMSLDDVHLNQIKERISKLKILNVPKMNSFLRSNCNFSTLSNRQKLEAAILFSKRVEKNVPLKLSVFDEFGKNQTRHEYLYDDSIKKAVAWNDTLRFGEAGTDKWQFGMRTRLLIEIEPLEEALSKSVIDFSLTDTVKAVEVVQENTVSMMKIERLVHLIRELKKVFIDITEKYGVISAEDVSVIQAKWDLGEVIDALGQPRGKRLINREDFYDMMLNLDRAQDAVVPVLYFEGVRSNKNPKKNEIVNLKITDLNKKKNELRVGMSDETKRTIPLEKAPAAIINGAAMERELDIEKNNGAILHIDQRDNPYIIMPMGSNGREGATVSQSSIDKRLLKVKNEYKHDLTNTGFSIRDLQHAGKQYYMKKVLHEMGEDADLSKAALLTLRRFGDISERDLNSTSEIVRTKKNRLLREYRKEN